MTVARMLGISTSNWRLSPNDWGNPPEPNGYLRVNVIEENLADKKDEKAELHAPRFFDARATTPPGLRIRFDLLGKVGLHRRAAVHGNRA